MVETAFVATSINKETKEIFVKQKSFAYGSEEAKNARQNEIKLLTFAREQGYNVVCDGKVIYDYISLKKEEERLAEAEKLLEIKQKDLTELTEEEIVLLAQSNVNETPSTYEGIEGAYQKVMDIMDEHQSIKDAIEQNQSGRPFH